MSDCAREAARGHLPTLNGVVQLPGYIGGTEYKDAGIVVAYTVHLHQEFGLDSSRPLGFAFVPCAGQGVDFVDEYDRRLVLPGHLEQLLDQPERAMDEQPYDATEDNQLTVPSLPAIY